MVYMKRAAEETIARISEMVPVLLVAGPRQVGKRPFCKNSRKNSEARDWIGSMLP